MRDVSPRLVSKQPLHSIKEYLHTPSLLFQLSQTPGRIPLISVHHACVATMI